MGLPEDLDRFVDEFGGWAELAQRCDSTDGLSDLDKTKTKQAILFLAEQFGQDFFQQGLRAGHRFPLFFLNTAPWTFKWLCEFADSLRELQPCDNYESLLARLKDKAKYGEAMSVLEAAYRLSKVGFTVSIEPKVTVSGREKKPDLMLLEAATNERLYAEVTILEESKASKDAYESMNSVTSPLHSGLPYLHWCGRLHKSLSDAHLRLVVSEVMRTCEKARASKLFQELVIPEVVELAVAPEEGLSDLTVWADQHGLKVGEFYGPASGSDEAPRIKHTIRKKEKQLPREHAGVVVIVTQAPSMMFADLGAAISDLEECVYDYPHLLGVVISGGYLGGGQDAAYRKGAHEFVTRTRHAFLKDEYLFLFNRFCRIKITPASVSKVQAAFRMR